MILETLSFITQSLTLVLPILIAGVSLIIILKKNYFSKLNIPVDCGITIKSKRMFGNNKTWRGIMVYITVSIAVCVLLANLAHLHPAVIHPLFLGHPLLIGLVFSLSYICGELLNSFIKRQLNIAPGRQSGTPLQAFIDNVDGMAIVSFILFSFFKVTLATIVVAITTGVILHLLTDVIMKKTGLKQ